MENVEFQACPDFKGIKTALAWAVAVTMLFQACPDFKGIKTLHEVEYVGHNCFKLALISKGLRPSAFAALDSAAAFQACPDFKGIKTKTMWSCRCFRKFQACPDFKGIKTFLATRAKYSTRVSSLP